ncbi:MAG: DNA recombination protein RmuC [Smithellaceae bacterium]|nr:DNA recombination protein RmuC [Smithellaceae bacterium]
MENNHILLFAAILVAIALALLWHRGRRTYERGKAESALEHAAIAERLHQREEQLQAARELLEREKTALEKQREENTLLKMKQAELETSIAEQQKAAQAKLVLLEEAKERLGDAFKALSAEALRVNNQAFIDQAKLTLEKYQESAVVDLKTRQKAIDDLVQPLRESLTRVDGSIAEMEKTRTGAFATLTEQIRSLGSAGEQLQRETSNLVKALKMPTVRGKWGELQLLRAVELAGLVEHCDFVVQESREAEDKKLRPDMIIKLPGNLNIVVDAKAPIMAYLESLEQEDEGARREKLRHHARQLRTHINNLSSKQYFAQCEPTPEFVVLFLPGESFFSAALSQEPDIIEYGVERKVILATPTTLIALLKLISYSWRQEQLTKNAEEVRLLGRELYERIQTMIEHFSGLGKSLDRAVDHYNKAMGSLDSRVLVSARKFKELGAAAGEDLETPPLIERSVRE